LIDLTPGTRINLFQYAGIAADLQEWIGRPVDLARRSRLKPRVRPNVEAGAIQAF
jgi:predicted nucleotidyltransferase